MDETPQLKFFKKPSPVHIQAQQIWLILVAIVMTSRRDPEKPTKITYGKLAEKMGYDSRAGLTLHRALGIVGDLCKMSNLPTLNSIVVNDITRAPGDHVVVRPRRTPEQEQADVMRQNWFAIRVPTTGTFRTVRELGSVTT